jgi:hypothetical protein
MRSIIVAAALALPFAARAETGLALHAFDRRAGPSAALDVPPLALRDVPGLALARDEGGGAGARRGRGAGVDPAIALVLGIIPGFGIGHLVAGSDRWPIWLIADVVIAVVFWGPWGGDGFGRGGLGLLVLVERVFEGLDAYGEARGRSVFRAEARPRSPALAALPGAEPRLLAAGGPPGLRF